MMATRQHRRQPLSLPSVNAACLVLFFTILTTEMVAFSFRPSSHHSLLRTTTTIRIQQQQQQQLRLSQQQSLTSPLCNYRHVGVSTRLSSSLSVPSLRLQQQPHQCRDVVIVGGGLAGLSVALYLSQLDPNRHITILEREDGLNPAATTKTAVASFAAAGMLAPFSERLPSGDYLELCLQSRRMYPEFIQLVETLAKEAGELGDGYLWQQQPRENNNNDNNKDPWTIGHMASGGFLAPALAGDSVATWAPPEDGTAIWLDAIQVRELEPQLHPENVVGGWWFPDDASVDARRLTCSLRAACVAGGVDFLSNMEVTSLDLRTAGSSSTVKDAAGGQCKGLWCKSTKSGKASTSSSSSSSSRYLQAKTVVVANGAWMRELLPVPIVPHKGQSLSLRMPNPTVTPFLKRVIFAQDSYIVPKADGRIVVGATVEAGSYDSNVTPAGLLHILSHALQLIPALKDCVVEETWAGLRPTTPDKWPLLGRTSQWNNLYLAGGYWRNGVLLAPKTGMLLAQQIVQDSTSSSSNADVETPLPLLSESDTALLQAFSWDRFTSKDGGNLLAANARYAASMHPVHSRSSGMGVAAAVGTELGSYSTARLAKLERQQDRNALWNTNNNKKQSAIDNKQQQQNNQNYGTDDNAAFERAALLGKQDGSAYTMGKNPKKEAAAVASTKQYVGDADAYTVGAAVSSETDSAASSGAGAAANGISLQDAYKAIQANKAKQQSASTTTTTAPNAKTDDADDDDERRPDPGKRIYHIDAETEERREVPPYTSPGDFLKMVEREKAAKAGGAGAGEKQNQPVTTPAASATVPPAATTNHDDNTVPEEQAMFDGYTVIQQSNSRTSRQEELVAMREARMQNRIGQETIDESQIGVQRPSS